MKKNFDVGLLLLRVTVALLMLLHGISKIKGGVGGIETAMVKNGLPAFVAYGVYIGEIIAPILMIIGWRTRIASLLVFFTMIVAVYVAHPTDVLKLNDHGASAIELQLLFVIGALALFFMGAGKYALSSKNKWD